MTVLRHLGSMPTLQAILYMPVIFGLIMLAGIALRWSLADVYATQLSHHLDAVGQNQSNKKDGQWRLAKKHLERTLELRPAYARYLEQAGIFNQRLFILGIDRKPLAKELGWQPNDATKSLDYMRRSLRLTPSWPYLWSRLAVSKLVWKQFDDELIGAMERSMHLGPWERSVQYKLAIFGLNNWEDLRGKACLFVLQVMKQTWTIEQMKHSDFYDINKMLSHANFAQARDNTCRPE